jgi:hypothetical protein
MMRIFRNKILTLFVVLLSSTANAQIIDSVFMHVPEKICPLLNQSIKFEMLAYFKADQTDSVRNRLIGYSSIILRDTMTKNIDFQATKSSKYSIKLFGNSDSTFVIGVIKTIQKPIVSSNIAFYNENWTPMEVFFVKPKLSDWFDVGLIKNNNIDSLWLKKVVESEYLEMNFRKDHTLELKCNSLEILNKEDKKLIQSLINKGSDYALETNYEIKVSSDKIMIENLKK